MENKTLTIFDFDDTLFTTDAQVGIIKRGEGVRYITPAEYAGYSPDPDEEIDFSQFQNYPLNPKPIEKTVAELRRAVLKNGIDSVFIVTARGESEPIEKVLENFGMPPVEIIAVASSNPEMKSDFVEKEAISGEYTSVVLFEDNFNNIKSIKKRVEGLGLKFTGYRVMNHGERIDSIIERLLKRRLKQTC